MNKEIIAEWLNDIATPTGISYSGDQTLSKSDVEKIVNYINELQQENRQMSLKYNQALSILSDFNLPCELEGFMDKNTDYCSLNCSMNDDVFNKCWNRYIEQELEKGVSDVED